MKNSDKSLPFIPLILGLILILLAMFGKPTNPELMTVGGVICGSLAVLCRLVVILTERINLSHNN